MSVLACSRNGCENIMCDRYSSTYGYLCDSCFDELVRLSADANVDEFVSSAADETNSERESYDKWNDEFPIR